MASNRFSRLLKILSGAAADAEDEIFVLEGRLEKFVHFWALVIRQFIRHRCLVRASALSYSTLIALIPLLAVALSLTSVLLKTQDREIFQHAVEQFIASVTPPANIPQNYLVRPTTNSPDSFLVLVTNRVIENGLTNPLAITTESVTNAPEASVVTVSAQKEIAAQVWTFVQNTQSATLGATGVVLLILVAISLLTRMEETFNDIWGVTRGRNWLRQVQVFCTTAMLGPILLIAALSLAGGGHFQATKEYVLQAPVIGKFIFELLPLLVLWIAFTLIYLLIPNTKVKFSAAFVGGAVAGTLWHLNNLFGFLYVSGVVMKSKIYGSIGLVPVFMIGLYFSWVFLLLGAQIAYAFQNRAAYLADRLADNVNQRGREFVALRLMTCLAQRFQNGLRPATLLQLSAELGIPSRLTQSVLRTLAHKQLVTEIAGTDVAFVPARPTENIHAYDILSAMRTGNGQELPLREDSSLAEIYGEFSRIEQAERVAASAISLRTLAERMPVAVALTEPKIVIAAAPAKLSTASPEPFAAEFSDEIEEAPEPVAPEILAEPVKPEVAAAAPVRPARRDVVMPSETEFPL
jgi:membrane protein